MFCQKCGKEMNDSMMYCQFCGALRPSDSVTKAPVNSVQPGSSLNVLTDVPFKSSGKSVRFFADHLEFKKKSIRYDDIVTLATRSSTTIHTYVGIPVGRSFDGSFVFVTNNGKKHKIIMNAINIFGIGKARRNEKLYSPLFEAIYTIVAKNMAQKLIDTIKGGATVEVADLTINSAEARTKEKRSKKTIVINKENYGGWIFTQGNGVFVTDKSGAQLYITPPFNDKNVLLVPYILDAIFS